LWGTLLFAVAGVAWGSGVFGSLENAGGFNAPNSQSQIESSLATSAFGRDAGDVVVLYTSVTATAGSLASEHAVNLTLSTLPRSDVLSDATYWSTHSNAFLSADGRATYVVIELAGSNDDARQANYDRIKNRLAATGLTDRVGGLVPTYEMISQLTSADIGHAESLSLPILLILLLIIFGSVTAASLPLAIGGLGILGSFTALRVLALITGVSIFSVNIATILGLGLGIDYGLFMVSRFREEIHRGGSTDEIVARTMSTAGRTVAFSGVTVAVGLSGLLLFPETFLRSMGYGGMLAVALDVIAALTTMPALLSVLGPRVNSLRIRQSLARPAAAVESGTFYRLATKVMRRPILISVVIVVLLLTLGSPFLKVTWGGTDASVLPTSAAPRLVATALARDFPGNPTAPVEVLVTFRTPLTGTPSQRVALATYFGRLARVAGVDDARVTGESAHAVRIDLNYGAGPNSAAAQSIVAHVRAIRPPLGARRYVGGQTAQLMDTLVSLGSVLPWMAVVVVSATFILLFLAFRSLVLPIKAIILNFLSLSVMFGVLVWVFQEGHLSGLLGFTATGTLDPSTPILMFAVVFGLSMDYEVFLLSRVREHYLATGDNDAAIATGLQRTGGVITGAALMLGVVVVTFSLSQITFTKLMGVGTVVALIVDVTLVRLALVPATMKLLGRANWWAPRVPGRLRGRRTMDPPVS
jgi:RND superfamily putative drug exporter